jgi:hypothetical protein
MRVITYKLLQDETKHSYVLYAGVRSLCISNDQTLIIKVQISESLIESSILLRCRCIYESLNQEHNVK